MTACKEEKTKPHIHKVSILCKCATWFYIYAIRQKLVFIPTRPPFNTDTKLFVSMHDFRRSQFGIAFLRLRHHIARQFHKSLPCY